MPTTVTNGIPTLGGQDFTDRNQTEQNVLRAMWKRLRQLDALLVVDPVDTADATDLASAIALANANKAKINEIIAGLAERTTL